MIDVKLESPPSIEITISATNSALVTNITKQTEISAEIMQISRGEPGPPGANGEGYNFTQTTALAAWQIVHNLGVKPSVDIYSTGGISMFGTVHHVSDNVTNVIFNTPVAGFARLN